MTDPLTGVAVMDSPSSAIFLVTLCAWVGDTGLEPVTSSVSRKRASQTAPIALVVPCTQNHAGRRTKPLQLRGGSGNRTRVQGFAGPCLSHSAIPPRGLDPTGRLAAPPSGRRDSNPRPSPWQGDALPAALRPRDARTTLQEPMWLDGRRRGRP